VGGWGGGWWGGGGGGVRAPEDNIDLTVNNLIRMSSLDNTEKRGWGGRGSGARG